MSVNADGYVICDRCKEVDEEATKWDKKKRVHICDACVKAVLELRTRRFKKDEPKEHKKERQETEEKYTTRDRALKAKDSPTFAPGRRRTNKGNIGRRFR